LEKQEQMKKNSIFEMATLKRQWKFEMDQLEAMYDQKDMAVINKYHNKLHVLELELAGNPAPLGFEKTPKLNTRGLELKGRLDAFASLKAENAAAYEQAIVLQGDLLIYEEAAEKDFEAGQAAERRRQAQAVMKERDAELLKLQKRRVGARAKLEHSLRVRRSLLPIALSPMGSTHAFHRLGSLRAPHHLQRPRRPPGWVAFACTQCATVAGAEHIAFRGSQHDAVNTGTLCNPLGSLSLLCLRSLYCSRRPPTSSS
jgi:hypothetical protein